MAWIGNTERNAPKDEAPEGGGVNVAGDNNTIKAGWSFRETLTTLCAVAGLITVIGGGWSYIIVQDRRLSNVEFTVAARTQPIEQIKTLTQDMELVKYQNQASLTDRAAIHAVLDRHDSQISDAAANMARINAKLDEALELLKAARK